jgi:glycosyltransferase involved in cell wall biosynthesis
LLEALSELSNLSILSRMSEVSDPLGQSDVILNLSDHEAFGRTVVEGLAAGCLPVCIRSTGPAEIVARVGLGLTIDRSAPELVAALDFIHGRRDVLEHARAAGPVAAELFDVNTVTRQWASEMRRVGTKS